jgi:Zn-dependent protease
MPRFGSAGYGSEILTIEHETTNLRFRRHATIPAERCAALKKKKMTAYNWTRIVEMTSDKELQEIVDNQSSNYDNDAISAAIKEIEKRKEQESYNIDPVFPPKPTLEESTQSLKKSVYSLAIFIAAFFLIFKWDLIYIFILAGVIFIHELGHYVAMRIYKYKDLSIFFIPLIGAYTSGEKEEISQKQQTIISLAGPIPGIVVGSLLLALGMEYENELLRKTGNIFVYLNLFNLLPIMPLDGGRVIKSLFFETNEKINIAFLFISIFLISIFALTQGSYFLLIIPIFLYLQVISQLNTNKVRKIIKNKGFDLDKSYEELSNEEYWLIRDELAKNMKVIANLVEPQRYFPVPDERTVINQIKDTLQKRPEKDISTIGKIFFVFSWILMFVFPIITLIFFALVFGLKI